MTIKDTLKAAIPVRKVGAGITAGAITVILFYVLGETWDIHPPAEVGSAVTTLITAVTSWFTPSVEV